MWHSHQQMKTIYMKSFGEGIHTYPLPNPRILYFGHKPINRLCRDSFGCKAIPSCNCSGENRVLQTIRVCIRTMILKGLGPSSPALPTGYIQVSTLIYNSCCYGSYRIESEKPAVAFPAELAIGARLTFLQRCFDCASVYKSNELQSSELFLFCQFLFDDGASKLVLHIQV